MTNAATLHVRNNDLRRLPVVINGQLCQVRVKPDRTACWSSTLCLYITETTPDARIDEDMCVGRSVLIVHVANASVSTTTHTIHRTKLAFMDYSMRLMFYADCDFNENDFERVVPLIAVMGEIVTVSAAFFEPLGTSRDGPCCCFACLHGLVACVCVHSRGFKP